MANHNQPGLSLSGTQVCDIVRERLVAHALSEAGEESGAQAERVRRAIRFETQVSSLDIDSVARCSLGSDIAAALEHAGMVLPEKAADEISYTIDDAQANDHTVASLGMRIKSNLARCLVADALRPKKAEVSAG